MARGIFVTGSSFRVGGAQQGRGGGGVRGGGGGGGGVILLFKGFLLVLAKFRFGGEIGRWAIVLWS